MAVVKFTGFESGNLNELISQGAGTIAVDGTVFNSIGGAYALKVTGAAGGNGPSQVIDGMSNAHVYISQYVRYDTDTSPSAQVWWMPWILTDVATGAIVAYVLIVHGTGGTIVLEAIALSAVNLGDSANIASSFAKNTWHHLETHFYRGTGATDGTLTIDLNGVNVYSKSSVDFGASNIKGIFTLQTIADAANAGRNYWTDDIVVGDAAFPGAAYVVARSPIAGTPTYDSWSKSTGTDAYAVLNDTPFSAADFISTALSSVAQTALIATFGATQSGHGTGVIASYDTLHAVKGALVAKTASTAAAGISQVGNILGTSSLNGVDITLTFSTAPIAGDVVVIWGGHTSTRPTPIGPSTAGYTQLGTTQTQSTNTFGVWYKIMGSTPDTTVVGQGTGNSADSTGYGCIVLRGVDTSNVSDATIVFANGSSTNPDPGSITPATTGAAVIIAAGTVVSDSTWTSPANYSATVAAGSNDTNPYSVGGAVRLSGLVAATPENPANWTTVSTGVWIAASIAIRPGSQAGSAASIRRRFGGVDTDTAIVLTTSDAYYETAVFTDTYANLNLSELGALHGSSSSLQTVEDIWMMAAYTSGPTPVVFWETPMTQLPPQIFQRPNMLGY